MKQKCLKVYRVGRQITQRGVLVRWQVQKPLVPCIVTIIYIIATDNDIVL